MSNNKFLYSIYKSVKTLNREKMDLHTRNINKLVGGGPNEDFTEIMTNLGLIEENVLNYFDQLKKYYKHYNPDSKENFNEKSKTKKIKKLIVGSDDEDQVLDEQTA